MASPEKEETNSVLNKANPVVRLTKLKLQIGTYNFCCFPEDYDVGCFDDLREPMLLSPTKQLKLSNVLRDPKTSFEDKVQELMYYWETVTNCLLNETPKRGVNPAAASAFINWIHPSTLKLVFHSSWITLSGALKTRCIVIVKRCLEAMPLADEKRLLVALVRAMDSPWDKNISGIMASDSPVPLEEALERLNTESAVMLATRLEMINSDVSFVDLARRLAETCSHCMQMDGCTFGDNGPGADKRYRFFIMDVGIAACVYTKDKEAAVQILKYLDLNEGLKLVQRFLMRMNSNPAPKAKIWKKCNDVLELAVRFYLLKALSSCEGEKVMRELMTVWAKSHLDTLRTSPWIAHDIVGNAANGTATFLLAKVLRDVCGAELTTCCIEICIRGLNQKLNQLIRIEGLPEPDRQQIKTIREELSEGFLFLADLFGENILTRRESVLTAFSLNPSEKCQKALRNVAAESGRIPQETDPATVVVFDPVVGVNEVETETSDGPRDDTCSNQPTVNYDIVVEDAATLDLKEEVYDDLLIVLKHPRYNPLHWGLDWPTMEKKCTHFIQHVASRSEIKLDFLHIDFNLHNGWRQQVEEDEFAGIEKGYEEYLPVESDSEPEPQLVKPRQSKKRVIRTDSDSSLEVKRRGRKSRKLTSDTDNSRPTATNKQRKLHLLSATDCDTGSTVDSDSLLGDCYQTYIPLPRSKAVLGRRRAETASPISDTDYFPNKKAKAKAMAVGKKAPAKKQPRPCITPPVPLIPYFLNGNTAKKDPAVTKVLRAYRQQKLTAKVAPQPQSFMSNPLIAELGMDPFNLLENSSNGINKNTLGKRLEFMNSYDNCHVLKANVAGLTSLEMLVPAPAEATVHMVQLQNDNPVQKPANDTSSTDNRAQSNDTASAPGNGEPSTATQEHLPKFNQTFKSITHTGPQSVIAAAVSGLGVTQPQVPTPVATVSSQFPSIVQTPIPNTVATISSQFPRGGHPPTSAPMSAVSGQYTNLAQQLQAVAGQLMTVTQPPRVSSVKPTASGTGAASSAASGTSATSKSPSSSSTSGSSTPGILRSLAGSRAFGGGPPGGNPAGGGSPGGGPPGGGPPGGGPPGGGPPGGGPSGASVSLRAALPGEVITYLTLRGKQPSNTILKPVKTASNILSGDAPSVVRTLDNNLQMNQVIRVIRNVPQQATAVYLNPRQTFAPHFPIDRTRVKPAILTSAFHPRPTQTLPAPCTVTRDEVQGAESIEEEDVKPVPNVRVIRPVVNIHPNQLATLQSQGYHPEVKVESEDPPGRPAVLNPTGVSSSTLEQLLEFEGVLKQFTETSKMKEKGEIKTEVSPDFTAAQVPCLKVPMSRILPVPNVPSPTSTVIKGPKVATKVVVVTSTATQALEISPGKTPPSKSSKSSKSKAVKSSPGSGSSGSGSSGSKCSPVPKPQQKPQEDEQTAQRIYAILDEYAEQLRNSPDLNNKPAPRRRSNPPTNPSQSSKRKKSSSKAKISGASSSTADMSPGVDDPGLGSEDSSSTTMQLSLGQESPVPEESPAPPPALETSTEGGNLKSVVTDATGEPEVRGHHRLICGTVHGSMFLKEPPTEGKSVLGAVPIYVHGHVRQMLMQTLKGQKVIRVQQVNMPGSSGGPNSTSTTLVLRHMMQSKASPASRVHLAFTSATDDQVKPPVSFHNTIQSPPATSPAPPTAPEPLRPTPDIDKAETAEFEIARRDETKCSGNVLVGPRTGRPRLQEKVLTESELLDNAAIRDRIIATGRAPDLEANEAAPFLNSSDPSGINGATMFCQRAPEEPTEPTDLEAHSDESREPATDGVLEIPTTSEYLIGAAAELYPELRLEGVDENSEEQTGMKSPVEESPQHELNSSTYIVQKKSELSSSVTENLDLNENGCSGDTVESNDDITSETMGLNSGSEATQSNDDPVLDQCALVTDSEGEPNGSSLSAEATVQTILAAKLLEPVPMEIEAKEPTFEQNNESCDVQAPEESSSESRKEVDGIISPSEAVEDLTINEVSIVSLASTLDHTAFFDTTIRRGGLDDSKDEFLDCSSNTSKNINDSTDSYNELNDLTDSPIGALDLCTYSEQNEQVQTVPSSYSPYEELALDLRISVSADDMASRVSSPLMTSSGSEIISSDPHESTLISTEAHISANSNSALTSSDENSIPQASTCISKDDNIPAIVPNLELAALDNNIKIKELIASISEKDINPANVPGSAATDNNIIDPTASISKNAIIPASVPGSAMATTDNEPTASISKNAIIPASVPGSATTDNNIIEPTASISKNAIIPASVPGSATTDNNIIDPTASISKNAIIPASVPGSAMATTDNEPTASISKNAIIPSSVPGSATTDNNIIKPTASISKNAIIPASVPGLVTTDNNIIEPTASISQNVCKCVHICTLANVSGLVMATSDNKPTASISKNDIIPASVPGLVTTDNNIIEPTASISNSAIIPESVPGSVLASPENNIIIEEPIASISQEVDIPANMLSTVMASSVNNIAIVPHVNAAISMDVNNPAHVLSPPLDAHSNAPEIVNVASNMDLEPASSLTLAENLSTVPSVEVGIEEPVEGNIISAKPPRVNTRSANGKGRKRTNWAHILNPSSRKSRTGPSNVPPVVSGSNASAESSIEVQAPEQLQTVSTEIEVAVSEPTTSKGLSTKSAAAAKTPRKRKLCDQMNSDGNVALNIDSNKEPPTPFDALSTLDDLAGSKPESKPNAPRGRKKQCLPKSGPMLTHSEEEIPQKRKYVRKQNTKSAMEQVEPLLTTQANTIEKKATKYTLKNMPTLTPTYFEPTSSGLDKVKKKTNVPKPRKNSAIPPLAQGISSTATGEPCAKKKKTATKASEVSSATPSRNNKQNKSKPGKDSPQCIIDLTNDSIASTPSPEFGNKIKQSRASTKAKALKSRVSFAPVTSTPNTQPHTKDPKEPTMPQSNSATKVRPKRLYVRKNKSESATTLKLKRSTAENTNQVNGEPSSSLGINGEQMQSSSEDHTPAPIVPDQPVFVQNIEHHQ